jgi:hypothetical protein
VCLRAQGEEADLQEQVARKRQVMGRDAGVWCGIVYCSGLVWYCLLFGSGVVLFIVRVWCGIVYCSGLVWFCLLFGSGVVRFGVLYDLVNSLCRRGVVGVAPFCTSTIMFPGHFVSDLCSRSIELIN